MPRPTFPALLAALPLLASLAAAASAALVATDRSAHARMTMPGATDVRWNGGLLGERFEVCRTVMIPHMDALLRDPHESHAWDNFLMAAGLGEGRGTGRPHGPPFNDGDFLKWMEAWIQVHAFSRDPADEARIDEMIAVIARAQREDGYLHTHKVIPQRRGATGTAAREFEDREHFETYNMGHLMTTACLHYRVTGKTTFLALARKAADYLETLCRTAPVDLARNAICPSHYMGVVELHRATGEPRYLELARRLIEIRSLVPARDGSDHNQDRTPLLEATEAVGHAVRANYLYAGVADLVAETGDPALRAVLDRLALDVSQQKRYVTGMTGALYDGASPDGADHRQHASIRTVHQAYGRGYQLPNLTAYNETCATIGYGLWLWRMLVLTGDAAHADQFEETLYNGILPGISLEGRHYFYVNPLRKLHAFTYPLRWSRTRTPNIKASFCCPPNVVRTIAQAHNYVFGLSPGAVHVNLYAPCTLDTHLPGGERIVLRQETDYPWSGEVRVLIDTAPAAATALRLRIPGWVRAGEARVRVNGEDLTPPVRPGSYFELRRVWRPNDVIRLDLAMPVVLLEANPLVEETRNQVAVRRGPLVYCLESNDLPEGVSLSDVALSADSAARFVPRRTEIAATPVVALEGEALVLPRPAWTAGQLYREASPAPSRTVALRLVPYYAWGNRGDTEMTVWLPAR
jgi:uncharacterized protein